MAYLPPNSSARTSLQAAFVPNGALPVGPSVGASRGKLPSAPLRSPPAPPRSPPTRKALPSMVQAQRTRRVHTSPLCTTNGQPTPTPRVQVQIDAPASNRRVISASNLISAPIETVWRLLTDYSRLSDHIPNLVISQRKPHPARTGIRVEQSGAQKIFGFEFRASLTMDMSEVSATSPQSRAINFQLVSSADFREFDGSWSMVAVGDNKTALYYSVSIVPKGLVPVRAIEWRISEDVPENMDAVRVECERRRRVAIASSSRTRQAEDQ